MQETGSCSLFNRFDLGSESRNLEEGAGTLVKEPLCLLFSSSPMFFTLSDVTVEVVDIPSSSACREILANLNSDETINTVTIIL